MHFWNGIFHEEVNMNQTRCLAESNIGSPPPCAPVSFWWIAAPRLKYSWNGNALPAFSPPVFPPPKGTNCDTKDLNSALEIWTWNKYLKVYLFKRSEKSFRLSNWDFVSCDGAANRKQSKYQNFWRRNTDWLDARWTAANRKSSFG